MASLSVSQLTFKNGETLAFGPNDIVLVVGRNSSGKSTFLREIRDKLTSASLQGKLVSKASFAGSSQAELSDRFHAYYKVTKEGGHEYVRNARGHVEFTVPSFGGGPANLRLGQAADAFITLLNAEGRLRLSKEVETVDIHRRKPSHPFHVFMVDAGKLSRTSKTIKQAFGLELMINRIGNPIRGYVATSFPSADTLSSDKALPETAELLVEQGDGLRSFAGIVSEIEAMSHPIVLIDEPEAFLHPPQAKRLGRNVVSSLGEDRQAFIATHSSIFLQGAITNLSKRLRVLRLERSERSVRVIDIGHAELKQAESLPSLANTNLLDSLFYDETIVCEADADCKLFENLLSDDGDRDRFWFSAGGKQQYPKVLRILTGFGVSWKAILDLDALLDWPILSALAKLKSLNIEPQKKRVASALKALKPVDLQGVRSAAISALSDNVDDEFAIRNAIKELEARRTSAPLKQYGLAAIPNGQERQAVEALLEDLAKVGIILLRQGELESYAPKVGGHGSNWVNSLLLNVDDHLQEVANLRDELCEALRLSSAS